MRLQGLPHHPLPVAGHSQQLQPAMHVVLEKPPGAAEWACLGRGAGEGGLSTAPRSLPEIQEIKSSGRTPRALHSASVLL